MSYNEGYYDGLSEGIPDVYVKSCAISAYKGYDRNIMGNLTINAKINVSTGDLI